LEPEGKHTAVARLISCFFWLTEGAQRLLMQDWQRASVVLHLGVSQLSHWTCTVCNIALLSFQVPAAAIADTYSKLVSL